MLGWKNKNIEGVRQYFLFPSSFPVTFHSTLLLLLRTHFFSLSNPPLLVLTRNAPVLQAKTLVMSGTQAPIKFTDEGSCFVSSQQVILKKV